MAGILDWDNSLSGDGFVPSSQLSSRRRAKIINDPVHGHVELEDYCVDVMDTMHFQRLRDCKQLGMADRVFPGATHSRFEHSIGVAYLAGKQMTHLYQKQKSEIFENESAYLLRRKVAELAGICHDLGHGPLGHVFDMSFLPHALDSFQRKELKEVHHEHRSVMLFRHLVDEYNLDLSQAEIKAVSELILGHGSGLVSDEPFMFQIVANEKNSLDVDKFDYIQRDTRNVNVKWGFDSDRLINASRVMHGEMAYHAREIYSIFDMFTTRFKLHKVIINHRVIKAVEMMAVDALLEADRVLKISESITDPTAFLKMSDYLLHSILHSEDPKLRTSKRLLERLNKRQLYKFVDEVLVPPHAPELTEEDISTCQSGDGSLLPSDMLVFVIKANHGMGPRNPVDNVDFFKTMEDVDTFRVRSDQISYVMPDVFEEKIVRVYSKEAEKVDAIKVAFRRCLHKHGIELSTEVTRKRRLAVN